MNASTSTVGKVIATRLSSVLCPLEIQLMGGLPSRLLFCVLLPGYGWVVLLVLPAGCLFGVIDPFGLKFTLITRPQRHRPGSRILGGSWESCKVQAANQGDNVTLLRIAEPLLNQATSTAREIRGKRGKPSIRVSRGDSAFYTHWFIAN
jgi:hypothetical protein